VVIGIDYIGNTSREGIHYPPSVVLGRCVVSPANRQQYDDAFEDETGSIYNNYIIYICCKHFSKSISLLFIASGKVENNSRKILGALYRLNNANFFVPT
jgi:hypothetical protein